jgi:MFS family permease
MDSVGITNKNTQALVNGILSIYTFLLALTTAFFVERIGRRPLFRTSTMGMLVVFIAWTAASARFQETGASSAGVAVMVLIFVYCAFYNIAFAPLAVAYSVEILPYSIRAKGMATYVFSTKAAVFVNQFGESPLSDRSRKTPLTRASQPDRPGEHRLEVLHCLCGDHRC